MWIWFQTVAAWIRKVHIFTSILANRTWKSFHSLVFLSQSSFVPLKVAIEYIWYIRPTRTIVVHGYTTMYTTDLLAKCCNIRRHTILNTVASLTNVHSDSNNEIPKYRSTTKHVYLESHAYTCSGHYASLCTRISLCMVMARSNPVYVREWHLTGRWSGLGNNQPITGRYHLDLDIQNSPGWAPIVIYWATNTRTDLTLYIDVLFSICGELQLFDLQPDCYQNL